MKIMKNWVYLRNLLISLKYCFKSVQHSRIFMILSCSFLPGWLLTSFVGIEKLFTAKFDKKNLPDCDIKYFIRIFVLQKAFSESPLILNYH